MGVDYRIVDDERREFCELGRGHVTAHGELQKVLKWAEGRKGLRVLSDHGDDEAYWLYEQTGAKWPGWRE